MQDHRKLFYGAEGVEGRGGRRWCWVKLLATMVGWRRKIKKKHPKIIHFRIQFCSKNLTHFMNLNSLDTKNNMLPQHRQKPFWLYKFSSKHVCIFCQKKHCTISWRPRTIFLGTLKANVCIFLYVSIRKVLFQRRCKILFGEGGEWVGGRPNNLLAVWFS